MRLRASTPTLRIRALVAIFLLTGINPFLRAQCATSLSASQFTCARGPSDPKELEEFLAPLLAEKMSAWHVPGAVLVMVKDGGIFLAKGYGYADWVRKLPIVPDRTIFRVGSVSKVFTATAVMQCAERGKLDLHRDVNSYLELFKIENNFPRPVTLENLLTHTGGFDDRAIGINAREPSRVIPLGPYLAERMPPRVNPPGEVYGYSSHGMALAGYLVEVVSGEPFDEYVRDHILQPLEMASSGFELTPELKKNLATGYVRRNGQLQPVPLDYFNLSPAMGLNATGTDMAHFMIAHLENGIYKGLRILEEKTVREMHAEHFTLDPHLPGRTYGFYERSRNSLRGIGHGGNVRGYGSLLFLLPQEHVGLFIACNLDEPQFLDELERAFLDHYYPPARERDLPRPPTDFSRRADELAGSYRITPYSRRSLEKLATLYWQYRVTADPNGFLTLHYPRDYRLPSRWAEISPWVFERLDDQEIALSRQDASGRVKELITDSGSHEKLSWWETARFQVRGVEILMLVFLTACFAWPTLFAASLWRKNPPKALDLPGLAWLAAGTVSALILFFIMGWVTTLRHMDLWEFTYGLPPFLHKLLFIPFVTTALTAVLLFFAMQAWRKRTWTVWGRLHYTAVTASALVFIAFLIYWNLLGFTN